MNKNFQETASLSIVLSLFIHKISSNHDRDGLWYLTKRNETKQLVIDETKQLVFDETKQSLTLERSGNCSPVAPNTLDTIAVLFR